MFSFEALQQAAGLKITPLLKRLSAQNDRLIYRLLRWGPSAGWSSQECVAAAVAMAAETNCIVEETGEWPTEVFEHLRVAVHTQPLNPFWLGLAMICSVGTSAPAIAENEAWNPFYGIGRKHRLFTRYCCEVVSIADLANKMNDLVALAPPLKIPPRHLLASVSPLSFFASLEPIDKGFGFSRQERLQLWLLVRVAFLIFLLLRQATINDCYESNDAATWCETQRFAIARPSKS